MIKLESLILIHKNARECHVSLIIPRPKEINQLFRDTEYFPLTLRAVESGC